MTDAEWEPFKLEIERLYCHENKTLHDLMQYMASTYALNKSKGQYQRQFKKWGFKKSLQSSSINWSFIGRRTEKRKLYEQKDSEVHINGVQIPPQKLKKAKFREAFTTCEAIFSAPSPDTPEGVVVCTPVTPGMNLAWNPSLPWLRFARLLQPEMGSDPPFSSFSLTVPSIQELNAPSQITTQESIQRLVSIVPWSKLSQPPNIHSSSRAATALTILMPEEVEGQHLGLSSELLDPKQMGRGRLILELFLLSNNLIFNAADIKLGEERVLEIFDESGWNNDKYLPILISSHEPTASAMAEKLFAIAFKLGDLKTVKNMLKAGMNPNTAVTVMGIVLTPLEFASIFAKGKSVELVLLLLAHGADVNFSYDYYSALNNAIISRDDSLISLLLAHGAIVTAKCLSLAMDRLNDAILRELIDACPNWNEPTKRLGSSFFARAVDAGRVAIARLLLTRGAEVSEFIELDFEGEVAVTTALGVAVRSRSLEMIRFILDVCDNVNPNVDGLDYVSPLTLAVELGESQITEMLLRAGVNVEAADHADSSTLIRRATERENLVLCQVLIKYGARIDEQVSGTEQESSALLVAIQKRAFDIVDLLINEHARLNDIYSETPGTILGAAIELGDQALINKLLSAGARIIREDQIRRIGNLDTAVYLHEIGCFQRILDTSGQQILAGALMARDESLIQYLFEHYADLRGSTAEVTPLRASIETGNLSSIKALLDRGATVTDGDLAAALNVMNTKCFQELLSMFRGSGPTAIGTAIHKRIFLGIFRDAGVNPTGVPVLAGAIEYSWMHLLAPVALEAPVSVLEIAVAFGSEKDLTLLLHWARWDKRLTGRALTTAIFLGRDNLVGELLEYGSDGEQEICIKHKLYCDDDLKEIWSEHFTPLQAAAKNQLLSAAEKLVQDVDVNYLGEGIHRRTALQHAVENGDIDLMNLLLRHGARVDGPPARNRGATALQIAAIRGYIGIARRLIDLGASVNEPPAIINGRTALEGAAEHGRLDMLQLLLDEGALVVGDGEKHYQRAIQLAERHGHGAAARLLRSFGDSLQVTTSEAT